MSIELRIFGREFLFVLDCWRIADEHTCNPIRGAQDAAREYLRDSVN